MSYRSLLGILLLGCCLSGLAQPQPGPAKTPEAPSRAAPKNYILAPNDVVHIKVFREDNLETKARIDNDGTITFPLLGSVQIGGKSVDQATQLIRDRLAEDYLVNPQVNLSITEYVKRRFTVLGQVQKPGVYEIPENQLMTLLQAISVAGGYTRIADASKITVQRQVGDRKSSFTHNAKSMAKDKNTKHFEILADDTITVGESIF